MSDELRYALALLFRKAKTPTPTRKDLMLLASMTLRWFSPMDAEVMISRAMEAGYLKSNGNGVSLTFDPATVAVPPGFTPSVELVKTKRTAGDELLPGIVKAISSKTGEDQRKVMARVNSMTLEMNVDVEVAALVLAMECGVDARPFVDRVRSEIYGRYKVSS